MPGLNLDFCPATNHHSLITIHSVPFLPASLDKAPAELDAGEGVPIERVREDIREWATSPKGSKK